MKRKVWNGVGWAAVLLLLWTAAASDAVRLPMWRVVVQVLLGGGGLLVCRMMPRISRYRRMLRCAKVMRLPAPPAEPIRAQM